MYVAGLYLQVAGQSKFEKCYTIGDNQHCFRTYLNSMKTFDEARKYCESIPDGPYSLVAVNDGPVQNALIDFMDVGDVFPEYIWLGLLQKTQGQWLWIDETRYSGETVTLAETNTSSSSLTSSSSSLSSLMFVQNVFIYITVNLETKPANHEALTATKEVNFREIFMAKLSLNFSKNFVKFIYTPKCQTISM